MSMVIVSLVRTGHRLPCQLPRLLHQVRIDCLRRWIRYYAPGKFSRLAIHPLTGICQGIKAKADPRRYVVCCFSGQIGGRTSLAGIQEAPYCMATCQTVKSGLMEIIGLNAKSQEEPFGYTKAHIRCFCTTKPRLQEKDHGLP
jgi:hypothetical protein